MYVFSHTCQQACHTAIPTTRQLEEFVTAFVNMYLYFQSFDWLLTWNSGQVYRVCALALGSCVRD